MFPTHIQHHHDNIRPSLITLDSPYNSYGVTHMARPWESALHVDPTCLDHNLSSTGTSIGPLNDRLPRSERLTRTSLSVSESSSTRTFSFCRSRLHCGSKITLCVCVFFLCFVSCCESISSIASTFVSLPNFADAIWFSKFSNLSL